MNSNEFIEVTLQFSPFSEELAEIVEAELAELPYDSFMIEEDCLKAYIQKDLYDARALKIVLGGLEFPVTFSANMMPSQNWNAQWEKEFTPIIVGRDVTVRALHHDDDDVAAAMASVGVHVRRTRYTIRINPQMAFGTGHHDTTFMMMQTMLAERDAIRGKVVMDMGCGTGVLAILAAKMGAAHTYGIDIDAVAAQSAFDNAHLNRIARKVETYCGDASLLQMGKYDVLLANIHRNIILMDMKTYARSLRSGGLLLVSGFYESDAQAIMAEAAERGLNFESQMTRDGWACLKFRKI